MLIIPPERLEQTILDDVLEAYINREGTDYGDRELSLEEKLANLRPQVYSGEVLIVYDEDNESLTLMTRRDYQRQFPQNS